MKVFKCIKLAVVTFLVTVIGFHISFDVLKETGQKFSLVEWFLYITTLPIIFIISVMAICLCAPVAINLFIQEKRKGVELEK